MDKRFSPLIVSVAQVAQARTCVPASVSLAQWALESAYGTRMPEGSNNPFGIKAHGNQQFVSAMTWEVVKGVNLRVSQHFRRFNSIGEAFEVHADLLATSHYYSDAIAIWKQNEENALARGVKSMALHYATDPDYASKVMRIIADNNLTAFDHEMRAVEPKPSVAPVAAAPKVSPATVTPKEDHMDKMLMPMGLAGSMVRALFTYGPMVGNLASHAIANSDDIRKKGADLFVKLKTFDVPGATVDFNAILSDFGLNAGHVEDAMHEANTSAPPSDDPFTSMIKSAASSLGANIKL